MTYKSTHVFTLMYRNSRKVAACPLGPQAAVTKCHRLGAAEHVYGPQLCGWTSKVKAPARSHEGPSWPADGWPLSVLTCLKKRGAGWRL